MDSFTVGQIVVVKFPFSNLATAKNRPALVLAVGDYGNPVLCQITSSIGNQLDWVVVLEEADVQDGNLQMKSYARVDKMFTADPSIIVRKIGVLSRGKQLEIKLKLVAFFGL